MKTLKEQVNEIVSANTSKSQKAAELKKIGITNYEISIMLGERCLEGDYTAARAISVTFGVEIECGLPRGAFATAAAANGFAYEYQGYNHNDSHRAFKLVSDGSVIIDGSIECVSPVLKGRNGKAALKLACKTLNEAGASVNRTCGLHVHIGAKDLTEKQYANVFVNYMHLETVIDTFMAVSRRSNNNGYCRSIKGRWLQGCETIEDVRRALEYNRYHKVNSESYGRHKTIEFRQHQGTTNFEKIFNWVQFCAKLVKWSMVNRLENDITSIDKIPFLTATEKRFFKAAAARLA